MIKNDLHPSEEPLRLLEWSSRHSAPAGAMYRARDDALYFASLFLYLHAFGRMYTFYMIKNDLHPSEEPLRLLEWSSRHSAPAGATYRARDDALYFSSLFLYFSSLMHAFGHMYTFYMIKNDLHPSEEPLRLLEWSSRHSAPAGDTYRARDDALYFAFATLSPILRLNLRLKARPVYGLWLSILFLRSTDRKS
jgi:hypothetical protein